MAPVVAVTTPLAKANAKVPLVGVELKVSVWMSLLAPRVVRLLSALLTLPANVVRLVE